MSPAKPTLEDILTLVRRYVAEHHPGDAPARLSVLLRSGEEIRLPFPAGGGETACAPDGSWLRWYREKPYAFTTDQAPAVLVLWEASRSGVPEVTAERLLEAAGSEGSRIRDVFKSSEAWQEGIISANKGKVRLNRPDEID